MSILLSITIALFVTFIGSRIAAHFKYPPILGQFIASFFLVIPFFKDVLFTEKTREVIGTFSELSVIFLVLLAGLNTNIKRVNQSKKDVISIAICNTLAPLFLGIAVGIMLDLGLMTSLIFGIIISITSEGANLAILIQLNRLKTKLGGIIISSVMINNIFGVILMSFVLILAHTNNLMSLTLFPAQLIIFIAIIWLASKLMPKIMAHFEKKGKETATFNLIILTALILAILSESLGLSSILGAYVAGVLLQKSFRLKRFEKNEEHEMETLLFGFIIPFFFINIALNFDFRILIDNPLLVLAVIGIAVFGKIFGALIAKPFTDLRWKQALLVGWEMNSRGMMDLVIANIALGAALITAPLYSSLVLTAIITTLLSAFIIRNMLRKHPDIMK